MTSINEAQDTHNNYSMHLGCSETTNSCHALHRIEHSTNVNGNELMNKMSERNTFDEKNTYSIYTHVSMRVMRSLNVYIVHCTISNSIQRF